MTTLKFFEAYQKAEFDKRYYEHLRGTRHGIAVEPDQRALRWQRLHRQSQKFERVIKRRLTAIKREGENVI